MIYKNLYLLPSPSCDENAIEEFNITKVFAVKSVVYEKWLETQNKIESHSFENLDTISNGDDVVNSPSFDDLLWIDDNLKNGERIGIMCANGFQRSIPVLCKYTQEYLDMPIYETILKVKNAYPDIISDANAYTEFVQRLHF